MPHDMTSGLVPIRHLLFAEYCSPECLLALVADGDCRCVCEGRYHGIATDMEVDTRFERETPVTDGVGERMAAIIAYVSRHPNGVRRPQVAAALNMQGADVGVYLRRAANSGRIFRPHRGVYMPVTRSA